MNVFPRTRAWLVEWLFIAPLARAIVECGRLDPLVKWWRS